MPDHDGRTHGDTQVLSSVTNAARILKEFGKGDKEIGVSELARRLGLGKSSTHRLVHTLTVERLLDQNPQTGLYRLAVTMHQLGSQVQEAADLHTAANPVVEQLRNLTKETVQISVLDGRHVVYVVRRESPQTVRLFGRVGHRNHAHCTSTGKVLLAGLPVTSSTSSWRAGVSHAARRTPSRRTPRYSTSSTRSGSAGGRTTSTRARSVSPPWQPRSAMRRASSQQCLSQARSSAWRRLPCTAMSAP